MFIWNAEYIEVFEYKNYKIGKRYKIPEIEKTGIIKKIEIDKKYPKELGDNQLPRIYVEICNLKIFGICFLKKLYFIDLRTNKIKKIG